MGDLVLLKLRPYRQETLQKKRNQKLSPKFFGPYKIVERIGPVAYKLDLPSDAAIHPVFTFHVSQLKQLLGQHEEICQDIPYVTENHEWKAGKRYMAI